MEYNPNPAQNVVITPAEQHRKDAVTAMVLGIIGLALSWWGVFTIAALVLSIIGFIRAKKNRDFARAQNIMEIGQNKAGYICSLIGLILSAIAIFFIVLLVVFITVVGVAFASEALPGILDKIPDISVTVPSSMCLF